MFFGCQFAAFIRLFVCPVWSYYHGFSWTALNLQQEIFISPYWWPCWILEVKGQGHSRLSKWLRHSRRRWSVEVHRLVFTLCRRITCFSDAWLYVAGTKKENIPTTWRSLSSATRRRSMLTSPSLFSTMAKEKRFYSIHQWCFSNRLSVRL